PNTENLIPSENTIKFEANLNELYNVIDRVSLLTQIKEKNIVQLEMKKDKLIITSNSPEIGKSEEIMTIKNLTNNDIKISFSAKYMLEALKTFTTEKIILLLNGEIKPIIIKETESGNLVQLILPIKTY
ncbi:DNA polymerase III subunit beta, partial [bacterium]|nr:DNA polymerase III subunit beta [bacterium]